MTEFEIASAGLVCGVGLSADAGFAAMRAATSMFTDTRFLDANGAWIVGSAVPLPEELRGRERMVTMLGMAVADCLRNAAWPLATPLPLLVGVAEPERPGRIDGLDASLLGDAARLAGIPPDRDSGVIAAGRASIGPALERAAELLASGREACVVAGVDTLLTGPTLAALEAGDRLLTTQYSNGFVPGEGASAVLLRRPGSSRAPAPRCIGLGSGRERATLGSGEPLRGDGLTRAVRAALEQCDRTLDDVDWRVADIGGSSYEFKEADLALNRILRSHKDGFDLWHPADCIGETGAAAGPCVLGNVLYAVRKDYAPGSTALCHFSSDDGHRIAAILTHAPGGR